MLHECGIAVIDPWCFLQVMSSEQRAPYLSGSRGPSSRARSCRSPSQDGNVPRSHSCSSAGRQGRTSRADTLPRQRHEAQTCCEPGARHSLPPPPALSTVSPALTVLAAAASEARRTHARSRGGVTAAVVGTFGTQLLAAEAPVAFGAGCSRGRGSTGGSAPAPSSAGRARAASGRQEPCWLPPARSTPRARQERCC